MPPPDPAVLDLLHPATRRLLRTVDGLSDEQYAEASGLPDWTRAHVVAHLALNSEGLAGALTGIVTGKPATMYRSQEGRGQDIEKLAAAKPGVIRDRFMAGCTELDEAIAAVPEDDLDTVIERTPGSDRTFRARLVPLMRLREVEIHHADLLTAYSRSDWPLPFALLLVEGLTKHSDASGPFVAAPTDAETTYARGEGGPTVSGTAADLGWWLTGRGTGEGLTSDSGEVPRIGAW